MSSCVSVSVAYSGWRHRQWTTMPSPNPVSSLLNFLLKNSICLSTPSKTIFFFVLSAKHHQEDNNLKRNESKRSHGSPYWSEKAKLHGTLAVVSDSEWFLSKRRGPSQPGNEWSLRTRTLSTQKIFLRLPWASRTDISGSHCPFSLPD